MAQLIIEIPDIYIQRLKIALTRLLNEGEAEDLENPTNEEIRLKAKSICIKHLREVWKAEEWKINNESFEFEVPIIE